MVLEADAGIVISSDDPKELTEAAAKLLDDPELRARFGRNAREYAEQAFRIDVVTDKFLAVFERDGESEKSGAGLQTTNALL
jgi:glycosyltransferase involved in cell wall biosynthesis